jgi:hypothetical protein
MRVGKIKTEEFIGGLLRIVEYSFLMDIYVIFFITAVHKWHAVYFSYMKN